MNNIRPVVILDIYLGGLQVGRALGKRGIPVFGVNRMADSVGAHSCYISILDAPAGGDSLCVFLIEFSQKAGIKPVLIPMSDYYLIFIHTYYQELSKYFLFSYSAQDTIERLVCKTGTAEIFADNNIPHPLTIRLEKGSCSISEDCSNIFPCILKPDLQDCWTSSQIIKECVGHGQRCIFLSSHEELDHILKTVGDIGNMVLQDFIPGNDLYYFVGYRNKQGEILASYIGKKMRTYPDGLGSETLLKSVHIVELCNIGINILHALNYVGPAGIDFKYDPRDGKFKVIEMNCRIGLNDSYLCKYGIDLPYIYYCDSQDLKIEPCTDYPDGITWYYFETDLYWMLKYSKDISVWFKWVIDFVKGYNTYAVFSVRDPVPFIKSMSVLFLKGFRKIKKMVLAKTSSITGT
jgi:D-aspartate ligase